MDGENKELRFKEEGVKLIREIGTQPKSRTQSVKTLIIEKDGKKFIALQKWWRKSHNLPWEEGKGFHFEPQEAQQVYSDLKSALDYLEN